MQVRKAVGRCKNPNPIALHTFQLHSLRSIFSVRIVGWVHTEEADHSSLMIKRMNCELTRLLRQQTSTQPGPTTSHETALGRTARASALVGRFAWSKTQEEDELVEVPNEDSEAVAAVLVVIRRDCGLLVLNRLIHNSVSLRKAPEGIGYR